MPSRDIHLKISLPASSFGIVDPMNTHVEINSLSSFVYFPDVSGFQASCLSSMYLITVSSWQWGRCIFIRIFLTARIAYLKYADSAPQSLTPMPSCAISRILSGAICGDTCLAKSLTLRPVLLCPYAVSYCAYPISAFGMVRIWPRYLVYLRK